MKATQKAKIKAYMLKHGSISQLEATYDLGITRLSARIWDLRHDGELIRAEYETSKNRDGEPVRYIRYRFEEGENDTLRTDGTVSATA